MTTILVFGCSWSRGVPEIDNFSSWPKYMAKMNPKWEVRNYAMGGTCNQFNFKNFITETEKFKNLKKPIKTVFQITAPHRLTINFLHNKECPPMMQDKNYHQICNEDNIYRLQPSVFQKEKAWEWLKHPKTEKLKKFYKHYLNYIDDYQTYHLKTMIFYLQSHCDYVFFHNHNMFKHQLVYNDNIDSLFSILGEEQYHNYVEDGGQHFGKDGLIFVATHIANRLKQE